jgi:hypothetical protein
MPKKEKIKVPAQVTKTGKKNSASKEPFGDSINGPADESAVKVQPMEKVTEKTVVPDPVTGEAVEKGKIQIFKSIYINSKVKVYVPNKRKEIVKVYVPVKENTISTANADIIAELKKIMDEYDELGTPLKQRHVLTEKQYYSITSPEKLYVPYKGNKLHINRVEEGLAVAEKHGWVPDFTEIVHIEDKKSRVRRGALSAGSAG